MPSEKETGLAAVTVYIVMLTVLVFYLQNEEWSRPKLWLLALAAIPVASYFLLARLFRFGD